MSPKHQRISDNSQESLGNSLLGALTQQEIALILDVLLENFSSSKLEPIFNRLPEDTQQVLQQILTPSTAVQTEQPTSLAKLQQTWSELWGQWNAIVLEATDEDGKYIEQEEHWEPPYFDDNIFVEDLEALAEQMLPLLPIAYEHEFSPDLDWAGVIEEMANEITAALPEWIQLVNEGFYLESCLTTCLLQWQWLKAQDKELDAFGFTQEVREWEERADQVELDGSAFYDFFSQLADGNLHLIYQGLSAHREALLWKIYLDNTDSHWHELYLYCLERYAPERRLETLRATISQQWQNGLPVLEDLLASGAHQESLSVVEETLASLLQRTRRERHWSPEGSLLVTLSGVYHGTEAYGDEITLLRYYQQAAAGLNQSECVKALELQLTAYEHRFNWSHMLTAFNQAAVSEATRQNLFQSWRDYLIHLAEGGFWRWGDNKTGDSWWLPWLLDSIANPQTGTEQFPIQIQQWLGDLEENENSSPQDFSALRLLTHDLAEIHGKNWNQAPNFQAVVLASGNLKTPDAQSRQSSLEQLAPKALWNQVMAYWQNHLGRWVPQPETARKSNYTEQAKWVAAWRELSPTAYKQLLAQWRVQHKQRRNLWKALAQIGLD